MATIKDLVTGLQGAAPGWSPPVLDKYEAIVDLTKNNIAAASDGLKIMELASGIWVLGAAITILQDAGAALTVNVGPSGAATKWISAANLHQAAGTVIKTGDNSETSGMGSNGTILTANEIEQLIFSAANSAAIFRLQFFGINIDGMLPSPV